MKLVEVRVSREESASVQSLLEEKGLTYFKSAAETETEKADRYTVPIPDEMLDDFFTSISEKIDFRKKINMVLAHEITASMSPSLQKFQDKARENFPPQNPIESVVQKMNRYLKPSWNLLLMALLASVVSVAGLFLNNVAVIVGGMLISPLIGPINSVSVNATLGRIKQMLLSEGTVLLLITSSILISAFVTFVSSRFISLTITSEILIRSNTTLLDWVIALILGVAAGLALVTDLPEILVGVAVAVALVPPAAVCGIGLALDKPHLFIGALLLTFTSLYGLNVGSILLLLLKGVSPRRYYEKAKAKKYSVYSLAVFLGILALLAGLIVISNGL